MKREIKFRAFQDNKMLTIPISSNYGIQRFFGLLYEDAPIMQFIGIKDKNGVDIYEGDIVQDIIVKMKSQIIFTDYANFGLKSNYIKDLEYEIIDPAWSETSCEIIGNIYENPELL